MTETVKKIKNVMDIYGWTQAEMAKRSGVSKTVVCRTFKDENEPSIENVEKMVKALGMEIRLYKE